MTERKSPDINPNVQERLLSAALELFITDDYNKVTTRQIADKANTSLSSITYYFGDKQSLYHEMVRLQFKDIEQALRASFDEKSGLDFEAVLLNYCDIHLRNPNFPAFLTRILAYREGPGYLLLAQILDRKRDLIAQMLEVSKQQHGMKQDIDIDVIRVAMMSLSVFPFLIKDVLQQGVREPFNDETLRSIALNAGKMLNTFCYSQQKTTVKHNSNSYLEL